MGRLQIAYPPKTVFYALWVGPESLSTWFKRTLIAPAPRLVRPARKGDT